MICKETNKQQQKQQKQQQHHQQQQQTTTSIKYCHTETMSFEWHSHAHCLRMDLNKITFPGTFFISPHSYIMGTILIWKKILDFTGNFLENSKFVNE